MGEREPRGVRGGEGPQNECDNRDAKLRPRTAQLLSNCADLSGDGPKTKRVGPPAGERLVLHVLLTRVCATHPVKQLCRLIPDHPCSKGIFPKEHGRSEAWREANRIREDWIAETSGRIFWPAIRL